MPWFTMDGKSIYESHKEPQFHLLIFGEEGLTSAELANVVTHKFGAVCSTDLFPLDGAATKAFGCDKPFVVLLRPDNYIGYISDDLSSGILSEHITCY